MTIAPTTNGLERLPTPAPARTGQATAVEQSRAVAEVQGAILAARQWPRDVEAAIQAMREACDRRYLAERAFYRYSRGGEQVTGESIHLARELARCWGNLSYAVDELSRDVTAHQSEVSAWAIDLETNTRSATKFIVPHGRDTKRGRKVLDDLRDVYENNANLGARRVREQILAVLPGWFVEEAKSRCRATLERSDDGKPVAQRRADAIAAFQDLGVTRSQLEAKIARKADEWTAGDLATLAVIHGSLARGETTRDAEFPPAATPAADLAADLTPAAPTPTDDEAAMDARLNEEPSQ